MTKTMRFLLKSGLKTIECKIIDYDLRIIIILLKEVETSVCFILRI